MPTFRCSCNVSDPFTRKTRKCYNKKYKFSIVCSFHLRKSVNIIQSFFRMKRAQKKIKCFKELPYDCWDKILYWFRYDHNVEQKYIKPLLNHHQSKLKDNFITFGRIRRTLYGTGVFINTYGFVDMGPPEIVLDALRKEIISREKYIYELEEYFYNNDKRLILTF